MRQEEINARIAKDKATKDKASTVDMFKPTSTEKEDEACARCDGDDSCSCKSQ